MPERLITTEQINLLESLFVEWIREPIRRDKILSDAEFGRRQVSRTLKLNFENPLKAGTLLPKKSQWWGVRFR